MSNPKFVPMPLAPRPPKTMEKALRIATIYYENELPEREYAVADKEYLLDKDSFGMLTASSAVRRLEERDVQFNFILQRNENLDRIKMNDDREPVTEWHGYHIVLETSDYGSKLYRFFGGTVHG